QPGLSTGLPVRIESPPAGFGAAQYEGVDHATPTQFGGGLGVAGRRPHRRMRALINRRPDVDVAMTVVPALPAERTVMRGQSHLNEIDRLPETLDIADRVGVARHHLAVARFDKADLEPAARDHVRGRIFLGHAHRVGADRYQGTEREDADLFG